jgi:adenylate cyclase
MFTDMVGFTALAQQSEQLALQTLDQQRRLMRPLLAKYRGREIQVVGDGFLVEFTSSLEAIRCAIEIQQTLKEENEKRTEDTRFLVRIGRSGIYSRSRAKSPRR